ncbi:DsbC family protein [Solimonas terrae]|uniref:Thiol:disulfide interchange protein n=1 Tax=Solimonas terrae TaxID=1396819 RepID=A0A6M2BMN2_9GAMM|nr:DsbC family protein [Solimonas terrae]NGY03856.1 DsbC family protein [Solimonas terrae]
MKPSLRTSIAFAALAALTACAPKQGSQIDTVRASLQEVLPGLKADAVRPSSVPGLYEVQDGSNFGYVTADGKYMIEGDLLNLKTGESLTENRRKTDRLTKLAELGEDNMIVFAPEGQTKHVVTVFTDVDCGYCRRLHSQMAQYNAEGIEIRYVSYPRTGPDSESFRKAEAVWCSADRKTALTEAKLGAPVSGGEKCADIVHREWDLGNDFGLRGTPLLVLDDGSIVNGYLPPDALEQRLDAPPGSVFNGQPRQG